MSNIINKFNMLKQYQKSKYNIKDFKEIKTIIRYQINQGTILIIIKIYQ